MNIKSNQHYRFSKACWLLLLGILLCGGNLFFFFIQNNNNNPKHLNAQSSEGFLPNIAGRRPDLDTLRWNQAMEEAKAMLAVHGEKAECLLPRLEHSKQLLRNNQFVDSRPPKPYLNVGFPKCGSSTLFDFFTCLGYRATHFTNNTLGDFEGICMRDATVLNGLPPLKTCAKDMDAILQMDVEYPLGIDGYFHRPFRDECFFPQLSLLEEFHRESPQATFLLTFRPIQDWIKSISGWGSTVMLNRFQLCDFPNLPRGIPEDLENKTQVYAAMAEFWCSHVLHLRNFVREFPSHSLIEMTLEDTMTSAQIMYGLFPTKVNPNKTSELTSELSNGCWGHSNANRPKKFLKRKKARDRRKWMQN
ncbi:MAG: hypothetical protein SGBAC_010679 [Bacillariaceae sp.]